MTFCRLDGFERLMKILREERLSEEVKLGLTNPNGTDKADWDQDHYELLVLQHIDTYWLWNTLES